MRQVLARVQRNALNITLVLMSAAMALSIYSLVQIQNERAATILRECADQNARHVATVHQLDVELALFSRGASKGKREQLSASRGFTILLIDQLAPLQNCRQVLAKSTTTTHK